MKKNKGTEVTVSELKDLALSMQGKAISAEDAKLIDLTDLLLEDIKQVIKRGELVNVQITGQVVSGKSTLMLKLLKVVLKELGQTLEMKHICADQMEFSRKVINPNLSHTCLGVDEFAALNLTGYNSSTEEAFLKQFSDVMAQRFLHRIACSPYTIMDDNSDIILDVLGKNVKTQTTRVIVMYRLRTPTSDLIKTIGHADIFVGDILTSSVYKQYRKRKEMKWDLLIRHGVRDLRELEFAELILKVFWKLRPLARQGITDNDTILICIGMLARQDKRLQSIPTEDFLVRNAAGMLKIVKVQTQNEKRLEKAIKQDKSEKDIEILKSTVEDLEVTLGEIIEEKEKLTEINREYVKI